MVGVVSRKRPTSWKSSVTVRLGKFGRRYCEGVDKVARFNGKNKLGFQGFNSILAGDFVG